MANAYPSWAQRDLETLIRWLMDAGEELAEIENTNDLPRNLRERTSNARTSVKGALMLAREIRSSQEDLLSNGTPKALAQTAQSAPETD